jgi:hypothetical protein
LSKKKLNRIEKKERRREEKKQKQQQKQKIKNKRKGNSSSKLKKHEETPSSYFDLHLENICEPGKTTPLFVEKCIEYIETQGI